MSEENIPKYDSFERENLQYELGNNFIGGDSLFYPTGGVQFHLRNRTFQKTFRASNLRKQHFSINHF